MNLNKQAEFFNPNDYDTPIHIIGCGAMGSTLAELLTRLGFPELHLYDFDTVTEHNITNQMYRACDVGKPKIDSLAEQLIAINPDIKINLFPEGWVEGTKLHGYVFLAVDDIDLRRKIVEQNKYNMQIKAWFDFRMRLTDAQHYAAKQTSLDAFLAQMQFSHDEAKEATPISACGTTLSVAPTIRMIVSAGVTNFINLLMKNELKKVILIDSFKYDIIAM